MTSLMTTSLILFSCWVHFVKCRAGDCSENILNFFAAFSGHYNNYDESHTGEGSSDRMDGIFKQVLVPALQKEPMFYMEEGVNGSVYRMLVGNVTQKAHDDIIYILFYNVTLPIQYKPGTFNTDYLANLPREAFTTHLDCVVEFKKVSNGVYAGLWPDCRHIVNKRRPGYTVVKNCKSMYVTVSVESKESTGRAPSYFKLIGPKFPMLCTPSGYVSPCKDDQ